MFAIVVFVRSASLLETEQAVIAQIARESVYRTAIRGRFATVRYWRDQRRWQTLRCKNRLAANAHLRTFDLAVQ
ncbi:hypothetical protein ASE85_03675 [Sphingobium sp. Leaf26]|nr:hypothetical protein ASE85_03675 [Sphingobium sp. Leaf26]